MALRIVTHTRGNNSTTLERCVQSVEASLPLGAYHDVVVCANNWAEARLTAAQSEEFVAFVDDDDIVTPGALQSCLSALIATGAGIAATYEYAVAPDGRLLQKLEDPKLYENVAVSPLTVHHLCVIRSAAVDPRALTLHNNFGIGIDWFINAGAALTHSAVCVPMVGYHWTRHKDSMSAETRKQYITKHTAMSRTISKVWGVRSGAIPIYQP